MNSNKVKRPNVVAATFGLISQENKTHPMGGRERPRVCEVALFRHRSPVSSGSRLWRAMLWLRQNVPRRPAFAGYFASASGTTALANSCTGRTANTLRS